MAKTVRNRRFGPVTTSLKTNGSHLEPKETAILNLELDSIKHEYPTPGRHKIAVRVVDILGQDTLQVVTANVE